MNAIITSALPKGEIKAIASKSMAHRLLICAAFADKESSIRCENVNNDILATVNCLCALGAEINYVDKSFLVKPISLFTNDAILNCNESGSTLRFLIPVVCAVCDKTSFMMSGRLPDRPLSPLREELEAHGIKFEYLQHDILTVSGRLECGDYTINGEVSSQFISGLLFALSFLDGRSTLTITGKIESAPYIEMTLDALKAFGASVFVNKNVYTVVGSNLRSNGVLSVEGDWSNAAFPLCAAALGGNIKLDNLNLASRQGDMEILDILTRFGAEIIKENDFVIVERRNLKAIELDASQIPDLVPVIATVASVAEGTTKIYGASRLRIKESDRLVSTRTMLNELGADVDETDDGLIIRGRSRLSGGTVSSFNDHRIAMSAAVASVVCDNSVTIKDAEAVNKSYPDFWEDIKKLGFDVSFDE